MLLFNNFSFIGLLDDYGLWWLDWDIIYWEQLVESTFSLFFFITDYDLNEVGNPVEFLFEELLFKLIVDFSSLWEVEWSFEQGS